MPANPSPELNEVLSRLNGVKRVGGEWMAQCPSHADNTASLSLTDGDEGVVMKCFAGCDTRDILADIGMDWTDLFPEVSKDTWEKVRDYRYTDSEGTTLFVKTRWLKPDGKKSFSISHPLSGGGWEKGYGPHPHVLFNLPAVIQAAREGGKAYIVEGEKDAETLIGLGLVATTNPGGAGKWLDIHSQALRGAQVRIIGDNDRPGKLHVKDILESLKRNGIDVNVSHHVKEAPAGFKDITDMVGKGLELSDLLPWTPPSFDLDDFEVKFKELKESPTEFKTKVSQIQRLVSKLIIEESDDLPEILNWKQWLDDNPNDNYHWVIPGLLEEAERVIVVAGEGTGKSFLARQIAIMCACGIHPFDQFQRIDPIRTLTIDLENPDKIVRRTSRALMELAVRHSGVNQPEAVITLMPAGINLISDKGRRVYESIVADVEPKILFSGPLYKSFLDPGGKSSESLATELAMFFDYLRTTYNCVLWLEQHAPLGNAIAGRDLRPFGSAVWSRWPEFGITLAPEPTEPGVYNFDRFRGDRDSRDFPKRLRRGGPGNFPFISAD